MKRTKCIACYSEKLKHLHTLKNMFVFAGVSKSSTDMNLKTDLILCMCEKCCLIQNTNLIPLNILYQANHNIGIVGGLWKAYFDEFISFMRKHVNNQSKILEVGDPSAKLAQLYFKNRKFGGDWTIVEPNYDPSLKLPNNIRFIPEFFTETLFETNEKYNVIVHSHCFEHFYNPLTVLKKMRSLLVNGGKMIFGIPNMGSY